MPTDHLVPVAAPEREPVTARARAHLLKAEREIAVLRWVGIVFWFLVLQWRGYRPAIDTVWLVYLIGLAYTALSHWSLRRPRHIARSARLTMLCDPLLAASMCAVTGGIESVFFPFLYLTALAAAFRFGVREALLILGLNFVLSVFLYACASPAHVRPDALVIAVFYNAFAAVLGAMLARWARDNMHLAEAHARALEAANDNIRALLHRLINAEEAERKRIADDLHDRMGGRLFTLQRGIDDAVREVDASSPLRRHLTSMAAETRACAADVRTLMNELRPTLLDELGLVETLEEHVANTAEMTPFEIAVEVDPALRKWRSRQDALLFRLVQEAILNVRKHADAKRVRVSLRRGADHVLLAVADDGRGFDPASVPPGHYGLQMMRERARALGGSLTVHSEPGTGTVVTVRLPSPDMRRCAPVGVQNR